jgi:hypothetical protein
MNNKEKKDENKNNQMKKSIIDFQKTIAQLENQNIQEEFHIIGNKMINKEDKIEEKINTLKRIFEQTKKKWKKILNDVFTLEKEIENIKNQMKKDFEKIKKEYQEELKETLQKKYDKKMNQELKKINDCFNKKIEEIINKMEERGKNQFEKFYNNNKNNENNNNKVIEIEKKEGYSFICLNSDELYAKINEGDNNAKIKIILKNNGSLPWKEGDTILCFNNKSKRSGDEINLNPQKPDEVNSYDIIFKSLQSSKPGEYPVILEFWIGDDNIGEKINAKIIIEEKK